MQCPVKKNFQANVNTVPPPFWWRGGPWEGSSQMLNIDEYTTSFPLQPIDQIRMKEELEANTVNGYQPGEISKGDAKKTVEERVTKCRVPQWTPRSPQFNNPFDGSTIPVTTTLYDDVVRRQNLTLGETLEIERLATEVECLLHPISCLCRCHKKSLQKRERERAAEVQSVEKECEVCGCPMRKVPPPKNLKNCVPGTNPYCTRDVVGRN